MTPIQAKAQEFLNAQDDVISADECRWNIRQTLRSCKAYQKAWRHHRFTKTDNPKEKVKIMPRFHPCQNCKHFKLSRLPKSQQTRGRVCFGHNPRYEKKG